MGKNIVLSGYFGFKNFGDEAILDVLLSKIEIFQNSITVITSNPEYTNEIHPNVKCVKTFDIKSIINIISNSDILISGGGSLLQDVTSLKSLLYYLFIIFLGVIFGKKVIIFAQGIGPINSKIGQILCKNILKYCSYICVRDEKSLELLKSWNINADLVCDPIFSLEVEQIQNKENIVGVQIRDFCSMTDEFINKLAQKVAQEFSDKKIEIYSFQDDIDKNVCLKFQKAINAINSNINTEVFTNLSNSQIIKLLAKNEYLIGMRFHSIIIGLLAKSKILSINYDIKVEKLSKEFNLPMIELNGDFGDNFEQLKTQNLPDTTSKVFDWDKFLQLNSLKN